MNNANARHPKKGAYHEDRGFFGHNSLTTPQNLLLSILGIGDSEILSKDFTLTIKVKPYVVPYLYLSDLAVSSDESRINGRHYDTTAPFKTGV